MMVSQHELARGVAESDQADAQQRVAVEGKASTAVGAKVVRDGTISGGAVQVPPVADVDRQFGRWLDQLARLVVVPSKRRPQCRVPVDNLLGGPGQLVDVEVAF